ncbi:MAG TPA: hypothetical protein VLS51_02125, partial [Propionibacteriaceae bacterium]|nr:hypothetical protein [Propionibacteriaceae bacterium]
VHMYTSVTRCPAPEPAPGVVPATSRELLDKLDHCERALVAAEVRKLEIIHELCLAFGTVDEDAFGEAAEKLVRYGAEGTPAVAEYLSLEVSALLGISPASGACLIGRVLDCVYRHPIMWEAVRSGAVRWYRATEVIGEVNSSGLCHDAAQWVDRQIAPRLATLPRGRALRLLRGYIALADPESARERETQARTRRHLTIWASTLESGPCRDLSGRLDVTDAVALGATLNQLAGILAAEGSTETLDQRRASALGILADPARAFQLLNGTDAPSQQQATVFVHIDPTSIDSDLTIARIHNHDALSRDTWVELLGHSRVTVRPLVDLNAAAPVDSYEIPDRIRTAVTMRSPVDMFPYGTMPSRNLDLDHTDPYVHGPAGPPGQTRVGNLAPLTRRVHRAKTAGAWRLTQYEGGWLEWTSPAGYRYASGPFGTLREAGASAA